MTIQSNSTTPAVCATSISSASAGINNGGQISSDTSSKISGYSNLTEAISKEASTANTIANKVTSFVTLIQSVASEFDVLDNLMAQQIQSNLSQFISVDGMSTPQTSNKSYQEGIAPAPWQTASQNSQSQRNTSLFPE